MAREIIRETETISDDRTVATNRGPNSFERLVYIIGGILLTLLGLRVLLSLLGANRANPFADFIYSVTYPFVQPFFGLFNYEVEYGVSRFEIETVVAILIYALVIALIGRLAALSKPDRTV